MRRIIIALALVLAVVAADATQYSKRSVIVESKKAGKWEALKSWIAAAGMTDEFNNASYLSDEVPEFATATNLIVQAGIATSDEIKTILSVSVDTAIPEALVRRMYSSDMATSDGRKRWHGNVKSVTYNTNSLVRVTSYEDGYQHSERFVAAAPTSIDQKISEAERKARRAAAKAAEAERSNRVRLARIAQLQTNMTYQVQQLMTAKKWPEELATVYLQHELNRLIGTNVVNAVVSPN